jgi:enamine deaminase RidA (YjgF/YER057c/UK114 family)
MTMTEMPRTLLPWVVSAPRLPDSLAPLEFARGTRAGRWVFVNGALGHDPSGTAGLDPAIEAAGSPYGGLPRFRKEARRVFAVASEVLSAGGSSLARAVRFDQYFTTWKSVPFFHTERVAACGEYVAPSTSILQKGLLYPGASFGMDLMAVAADAPEGVRAVFPDGLDLPSTSAFAPVSVSGDMAFIAGFMAAWKPGDLGGIAPEARVPVGHLWKGYDAKLEADYLLRNKLAPALAAAGSDFDHVVKAQVYLRDIADVPAFNEVWHAWFPRRRPAVTYVPTTNPGFAIADAGMEINLVAWRAGAPGYTAIDGAVAIEGSPAAVRAGDLVCLTGLLAADGDGPLPGVAPHPRAPRFGDTVEAQMAYLIGQAEQICAAAGTSLERVASIRQFHTDLGEFHASARAWQRRLPGRALPIGAVEVPGPLAVPGCTIQIDLWVHAG